MAKRRVRRPLFARLKQGLGEGIQHAQGKLSLRTVEVPEPPPPVDAVTLTALRESIDMSQAVLARVLNVSPKTVQSWEQGTRRPSQASLRLIEVLGKRPDVLLEVAGLRSAGGIGNPVTVTVRGRKRAAARRSGAH